SPGLPMDFLNATMHSGWGFFRNTDDLYGVKVTAEELGFLSWQVTSAFYDKPQFFKNLKQMGFKDLAILKRFADMLATTLGEFDYDLDLIASKCHERCMVLCDDEPALTSFCAEISDAQLKVFALAFMEDCHEFSRVSHFFEETNEANMAKPGEDARHAITEADITSESMTLTSGVFIDGEPEDVRAAEELAKAAESAAIAKTIARSLNCLSNLTGNRAEFNLALRNYRRQNPWLADNISGTDRFNRISEDGYTLFYGVRTQPDPNDDIPSVERKQVAMIAHMGGGPAQTAFFDWLQLNADEWAIAVASPGLSLSDARSLNGLLLEDGQAVLLEKKHIVT
ncbi:MAG: glucosylglycerol hydrolase, partial [Cyanobacteria bacterium J06576_12]